MPVACDLPADPSRAVVRPAGGNARFWRRHALLPAALLAIASVWLMGLHADFAIADRLYALGGGAWAWKEAWLGERLIHVGGRNASVLAWLLVFALWLATFFAGRLRALRRPLGYLALATALATTLVNLLKRGSGMDCPWDLQRYGGSRPFVALWAERPDGLAASGCFPAGHASAAYCWVALYFFFLVVRPRWRWPGLAIALLAGLVFGVSQQVRGAHFLSHDVWTLAICWYLALALYVLMFRRVSPA